MKNHFAIFSLSLLSHFAHSAGFPNTTSDGRPLFAVRAPDATCGAGDITTNAASPCFSAVAPRSDEFYLEVPSGTSNLTVEIFDPDVGIGALTEASAGRDSAAGATTAALGAASSYELFNPSSVAQSTLFALGNSTAPAGSDNQWQTLFASASPVAGHWRVRITGLRENATVSSDHINYFGIRACSTTTSTGNARCSSGVNRDLNVYARSYLHLGNQNTTLTSTDDYTLANGSSRLYPYVTHGCDYQHYDFDNDSQASAQETLFARNSGAGVTVTGANMSGSTLWNSEAFSTRAANGQPINYGIWGWEGIVGNNNANHITIAAGSELTVNPVTTAPQSQPLINSFRFYLPTLAGSAPAKPRIAAEVTSTGAVVVGSILTITLRFTNPTDYAVNFGASGDVVTVPINSTRVTLSGTPSVISGGGSVSFTSPNVIWNPGVVAANSVEEMSFQVSVNAGTTGAFSVSAAPTVSNDDIGVNAGTAVGGVRGIYLDETNTRFRMGPICSLQATVNSTTTPAVVSHWQTHSDAKQVSVVFTTAAEVDTQGFNILQHSANGWRRLNANLIGAQARSAFEPTRYRLSFYSDSLEPLMLEEISSNGTPSRHGPFAVGAELGSDKLSPSYDWRQSALEVQQSMRQKQSKLHSALLINSMVYLGAEQDGLYRMSYEQLRDSGADFAGVPAAELALSRRGVSVARRIELAADSDGAFGPGAVLEFYSAGRDSLYSTRSVYLFKRDAAAALAAREINAVGANVARVTALQSLDSAPNRLYSFSAPNGDPWYAMGVTRFDNTGPAQGNFDFTANALAASVPVTLQIKLWGGLDLAGDAPDHAIEVLLNGVSLGSSVFDGIRENVLLRQVPAGAIHSGNNQLTLRLMNTTGFATDRVNLEGVSLHYDAALVSDPNTRAGAVRFNIPFSEAAPVADSLFADGLEPQSRLSCDATLDSDTCERYEVDGFDPAQSNIAVTARAKDGTTLWLTPALRTTALGTAASVQLLSNQMLDSAQPINFTPRTLALLPSASLATVDPQLLTGTANYLIISHASLINGLAPLVAARSAEGFSVKVVDVQSLYATYSGGEVDPLAIQRYIRDAYNQLGTRYVLLAGGDSYDYQNNLGLNAQSLIPSFYRQTHPVIRYAPTDLPFADINDDGRADVAIGRIPARTLSELSNMVGKILNYASAAHPRSALNLADLSQTFAFAPALNQWQQQLPASWAQQTLRLDDYPSIPAAQTQFLAALNNGAALTNYYGHSSPSTWSFSSLLNYQTLANGALNNAALPTVVVQAGCWGGYHITPQFDALAQGWLTKNASGAAALLGGTGLTTTDSDEVVFRALINHLGAGEPLGDALNSAAAEYLNAGGKTSDVLGLILLGDPSMRIRN
jgi:hypothetical protein